jgi:dehydrogenase/reductase SDR family protein 12
LRTKLWSGTPPLGPGALEGKTALVTGASSGIGYCVARMLAGSGARLILVGRHEGALQESLRQLEGEMHVAHVVDLEDPRLLGTFAQSLLDQCEKLDLVVHCAGALHRHYRESFGSESSFALGVLAPFSLVNLLWPLMVKVEDPRLILVSSGGMYLVPFSLDKLNPLESDYKGAKAYAEAKRSQVVLARAMADRFQGALGHGLLAVSMHPGWVDTPGLATGMPRFHRLMKPLLRSPEQGADTVAWLCGVERSSLKNGGFYFDRQLRFPYRPPVSWPPVAGARHQANALWAYCEAHPWWQIAKMVACATSLP